MTVIFRNEAADELLIQFRRGVDRILTHPNAWQALDDTRRRYRINRFPYGIVYRVDKNLDAIVIIAFMNLSQKPGYWRSRDR